ncbi:MAG TPA: ABC transporter permease [Burkholderiaceae bacterium]|jgi:simple sugar transport system permease protein|nr:ABC transporter permease [Burkholderiaceae bacterium]
MSGDESAWLTVLAAILGGALRVSTPFLFVSLGETLTERSGRVNLGLEGTLVFGAMSGYAVAFHADSAWAGVLAAGAFGTVFGLVHGLVCSLPRVNDVAFGIALMTLGLGLAFFFGKGYVQPTAPRLPEIALGGWSDSPALQSALQINVLLLIGIACALALAWALRSTRWGLVLRTVGDSANAARALGFPVTAVRTCATAAGGFMAGVGGSFLSLYYPGSWNEALSSGQGVMAVALVIFARWHPMGCVWAALLFGGTGAIGPALQAIGVQQGYHLWNAAPYVLTLFVMVATSSARRSMAGAPGELSLTR